MARTLTGNSRRREQRLQSLLLDRLVIKYERRLAREIVRAMRSAGKAIESGDAMPAVLFLPEHQDRISRMMQTLWADSGKQMSQHVLGTEKALPYVMELKREQPEIRPTDIADSAMREWIRSVGTKKITQITSTTQDDVQRIINGGISEGLSEREIGRRIFEIAPTKSASRSQTIARTETHAASQFAANASAEAVGADMVRVWVSAQGERTRDTHDQADGQTVGMSEPFDIGGFELMYPGDPMGPAEEVINCRCCVVFEMV